MALLPLDLVVGKTYDVTVEGLRTPTDSPGRHYRLGSTDRRLQLGWAGPLHYLEGFQVWAVNADEGEEVRIEMATYPGGDSAPPQASAVEITVHSIEGTQVLAATTFTSFPATLSFTPPRGGMLLVRLNADGHFSVAKESGSDGGFYALPCPRGAPPPKHLVPPAQPEGGYSSLSPDAPVGGNTTGEVASGGPLGMLREFNAPVLLSLGAVAFLGGGLFWLSTRSRRTGRASAPPPAGTATSPDAPTPAIQLTAREREVLALITQGLSNSQIAARLVISQGTVKRHVENILQKLGLESRTQAAAWAAHHRLFQNPASSGRGPANGD